jgi:hypothetical protein
VLDVELTTPHQKKSAYYEILHRASDLDRSNGANKKKDII